VVLGVGVGVGWCAVRDGGHSGQMHLPVFTSTHACLSLSQARFWPVSGTNTILESWSIRTSGHFSLMQRNQARLEFSFSAIAGCVKNAEDRCQQAPVQRRPTEERIGPFHSNPHSDVNLASAFTP
jgi:hypothetical protein